jgi:hypothetical protein
MRALLLLTVILGAGCATQPASPNPPPGGEGLAPTVLQRATSPPEVEAQRLAKAKNLNLKVVNKDGQELYCRSNYVTASHIQRDTTCYTADQIARMDEATTRELDQQSIKPNLQKNF